MVMRQSSAQRFYIGHSNTECDVWRHSAPAVQLIPSEDDNDMTIGTSPLFLEALNAK